MDRRLLLAADALFLDWDSAALFKSIYRPQWVMQLGAQYRATERFKMRAGYALAENPIDGSVGSSIGPVAVPGGIKSVKYLQSQFAIVNQHRFAAGFGYADLIPGLDVDAFAGGMFPATEFLGDATRVDISSYWIGLGLTWHFDRPQPRPGSPKTAATAI
jgi:long-chain fatty acid transport protein